MLAGLLRLRLIVCVAALAAGAGASDPPYPAAAVGLRDAAPVWMGPGGARIAVGPDGLIGASEGVQAWPLAPDGGATRLSTSGSPAKLEGAVDEYGALSYRDGKGLHVGAAGSRGPDWAARPPLAASPFFGDAHGALAAARLDELQLRSELAVFPQVPGVQLIVSITNRSSGPVQDVTYSREWRQADGRMTRAQWSLGALLPSATAAVVLWYLPSGTVPPAPGQDWPASALDLPVTLWVGPNHLFGLDIGATNGVSWGDFDGDGYPDLYAAACGNLWHNDAGLDWTLANNLDTLMPQATIRYGASFGDYDGDGRPDLIIEPRKVLTGDTCWHLLHNVDGAGTFELADAQFDVPACMSDGETACWGDLDGDGRLDLFMPSYPPWVLNGAGNFLYHNTGPGAGPMLHEISAAANADVPPPDTARPEGAQMCDIDGDGDVDLYSNGWVYQNDGQPGAPHFLTIPASISGISYPTVMDEGAALFDYDLDGDFDLVVAYEDAAYGVKLFENRGDGTFFETDASVIDGPWLGLGLGLSIEDWDGDGDLDFSTRQVFRRNQLMETGQRKFTLGLVPIPLAFMSSATPAWGDWDKDGDLDLALGNYLGNGSFWTNTSAVPGEPPAQRNDVRVVPLDEGPGGGLQTDYGATIELRVHGDGDSPGGGPMRRKRFTASSGGYLNQDEYGQTFHLPIDTPPGSGLGTTFDVVVDFPGSPGSFLPGQQTGAGTLRRIDRNVNPALGGLVLAALTDREIRVFRDGRVIVDGQSYEPDLVQPLDLTTSVGGLQLPTTTFNPVPLQAAPSPNRWIGVELDTGAATHPVHVSEVILDAQLDTPVTCGTPCNLALWDVTTPFNAQIVPGGAIVSSTSPRNNRSFIPVDFTLQPGRRYRLVARATSYRYTTVTGLPVTLPVKVNGALNFRNDSPCASAAVVASPLNTSREYLAVRWGEEHHTDWVSLGGGLAGVAGPPLLTGTGDLAVGQTVTVSVRGGAPSAPVWFVLGVNVANLPLKGGTLVPQPLIVVGGLSTGADGKLSASAQLAFALPPATPIIAQAWLLDAAGPQGVSATNAIEGISP